MKPRINWTNGLTFLLGLGLGYIGLSRAVAGLAVLGALLVAGTVGMAWRKRWGHGLALAGLAAAFALSTLRFINSFQWPSAVAALGMALLLWDVFREMRSDARARSRPLIALVLFRRAPNNFLTDTKISEMVRRLWGDQIEQPGGTEEAWYAIGRSPSFLVKAPGMVLLVNHFARPYFDDNADAAAAVQELRLQHIVREHVAWTSVDLLHLDDDKRPRAEAYPFVGRLLAELADDDCLAIFCPETGRLVPFEPGLLEKLRSDRPLEVFGEMPFVPVVSVDGDDPRIKAAVAEARTRWPEFVTAFGTGDGEHFAVKAPVTADDNTEFIWIEVEAIDGEEVRGKLANDPVALGELKCGDPVSIRVGDLNDWNFIRGGELHGGFTVKAIDAIQRG